MEELNIPKRGLSKIKADFKSNDLYNYYQSLIEKNCFW